MKLFLVVLFITGFPMALGTVFLNKKWKFLPNDGIFGNFFSIGIFYGSSIWILWFVLLTFKLISVII